jgi:hypothetical protein
MLTEGRRHLSRSMLRQRLLNCLFLEQGELDAEIDILLGEVARRQRIAPNIYPFEESSVGLARKMGAEEAPYEFLLWLSVSHRFREEGRFPEVDLLFDALVKHALAQYLGTSGRAIRFAHPSSDGRPPGFPEAVRWLANLLKLRTGPAEPRTVRKDGGVDVVAWRPFRDGRTGFIVILCQCTVQQDWPPKSKDVIANQWRGWIDFGGDPVTALAIPFAIGPSFDRWDEQRRIVDMVLDRLRLCELVEPARLEGLEELRAWAAAERTLLAHVPQPQ